MELQTITLGEYVQRIKADIKAFEKYWMKGRAEDFPRDLPLGDWDEQFQLFSEQKHGTSA